MTNTSPPEDPWLETLRRVREANQRIREAFAQQPTQAPSPVTPREDDRA